VEVAEREFTVPHEGGGKKGESKETLSKGEGLFGVEIVLASLR